MVYGTKVSPVIVQLYGAEVRIDLEAEPGVSYCLPVAPKVTFDLMFGA